MPTWSKMRHKLETEYLAPSLRGRVQYFVTTYRQCHDREGRAAILVDGKEILQGNYFHFYSKAHLLEEAQNPWLQPTESTLELGMLEQRSFYRAFEVFDNQSIEESLQSDNLLVRVFAVLDRRVGKRRLRAIAPHIEEYPPIFRLFYKVRCNAEGLKKPENTGEIEEKTSLSYDGEK